MDERKLQEIKHANDRIKSFASSINLRYSKYDMLNAGDILSDDDIESFMLDGRIYAPIISETCHRKCNEMEKLARFKFLAMSMHNAPSGTHQITIRNTYNLEDEERFVPSEEQEEKIKKAEAFNCFEIIGNMVIEEMTFPVRVHEAQLRVLADRWFPNNPAVTYI